MAMTPFRTSCGRGGFTLTELMAVVTVVGLLSAIAVPKYTDLVRKSREGSTKGNLGTIRSAIRIYYSDNEGRYPTGDLSSLTEASKYVAEFPLAEAANHHSKTRTVENNDVWGQAGMTTADSGAWLYWNDQSLEFSHYRWGDFWIGCTHTDTQARVWTAY
ncbi:MAG: prepilin-type N-terminal cleavage/methylation domain-containing protein [Elusimicrobiota bacterium]